MFSFTDCKRDDKLYDNGDKIVDPENPCRVCVCRGQYYHVKLHKIIFAGTLAHK